MLLCDNIVALITAPWPRVADMAAACVQVQKLHVDVGVQGVAVDFCNNPQVSRALKSPHLALTATMPCHAMPCHASLHC